MLVLIGSLRICLSQVHSPECVGDKKIAGAAHPHSMSEELRQLWMWTRTECPAYARFKSKGEEMEEDQNLDGFDVHEAEAAVAEGPDDVEPLDELRDELRDERAGPQWEGSTQLPSRQFSTFQQRFGRSPTRSEEELGEEQWDSITDGITEAAAQASQKGRSTPAFRLFGHVEPGKTSTVHGVLAAELEDGRAAQEQAAAEAELEDGRAQQQEAAAEAAASAAGVDERRASPNSGPNDIDMTTANSNGNHRVSMHARMVPAAALSHRLHCLCPVFTASVPSHG